MSPCEVSVILVGFLKKLDDPRLLFEIYSNIKFRENPSTGSRIVPYGLMDGHDETNSRFSQFYEWAGKRAL